MFVTVLQKEQRWVKCKIARLALAEEQIGDHNGHSADSDEDREDSVEGMAWDFRDLQKI